MKTHKLKHSGIKPFPCDECSSRFGTKSLLNQHKRIHARKSAAQNTVDTTSGRISKRVAEQIANDDTEDPAVQSSDNDFDCNAFEGVVDRSSKPEMEQLMINFNEKSLVSDQLEVNSQHVEKIAGNTETLQQTVDLYEFENAKADGNITEQPVSTYELEKSKVGENSETIEPIISRYEIEKTIINALAIEVLHRTQMEEPVSVSTENVSRSHDNLKKSPEKYYQRRPRKIDKPFVCSECDEKFATEWRFKIHKRTHTGENKFICEQCGKSFNRKDSLDKHKEYHAGIKRFQCDICGMKMSGKGHLRRHIIRHIGVKENFCDKCPSKFFTKSELKQHENHSHRKKVPAL